jgi:hypothetical protein
MRKKKRKMKTRHSEAAQTLRSSRRDWIPFPILLLLVLPLLGAGVCSYASARPGNDPNKPYALIFGTVWGPDDHPVYGVKVKIRRGDQKKAKWELVSDHLGEFAQRVPAGKATYIVWVEAQDLKNAKLSNGKQLEPGPEVTVDITADERQDIGLHLK